VEGDLRETGERGRRRPRGSLSSLDASSLPCPRSQERVSAKDSGVSSLRPMCDSFFLILLGSALGAPPDESTILEVAPSSLLPACACAASSMRREASTIESQGQSRPLANVARRARRSSQCLLKCSRASCK
jgi:hypothetical protein